MQQMLVYDASQVSEARRLTAHACRKWGLDETNLAQAELVVTEFATNLIKHAGGGILVIDINQGRNGIDLTILSLDKGPGIGNPNEALHDGYTTTGSPGTGLGAIRRLSGLFDTYSVPGKGTALLSIMRFKKTGDAYLDYHYSAGAVCLPLTGEKACGDNWAVEQLKDRTVVLAVDGLGHGSLAAEAGHEAVKSFKQNVMHSLPEIMGLIDRALQSTRGAAAAVAEIIPGSQIVRYCGIGNISGRIVSAKEERKLITFNGTLGMGAGKIREFTYPWSENSLLIMHSDGLTARWHAENYPGLWLKHPVLVAGVLYRDHNRPKDDSVVVVVRGRNN